MSYAQKKELSGNRTAAIIIVAIIQFTLGYAIVTGLAYNVIKHAAENLKTFDVEQQPPPPEKPPPPPPKQATPPPPVVAPPPIVRTAPMAPVIQTVREAPPPVITPQAPPAPPPPPPAKVESAHAKGDVRALFSGVEYPDAAVREGVEGTLIARLTISPSGKVSDCNVIKSSGSSILDSFACRILRRASFTPARDSNGNAISDTYTTPTIRFQLTG